MEAHQAISGGLFSGEVTTRKIWQASLWWPPISKDTTKVAKECDLCQRIGKPTEKDRIPFQPVLPLEPFKKWGLDFVGPFKLAAMRTGNLRYIIVPIDYCIPET